MSKTLYLHIGLPKTGTTSIQFFCRDNKELLEKNYGLYYPEAGRISLTPGSNGPGIAHYGLVTPSNDPMQFTTKAWKSLFKEIKDHSEADIIISNESLGSIFRPARLGAAAFKSISEYCPGYAIKVIVYLRRYDDCLKSLYNQFLKEKNTVPYDTLSGRLRYGIYLNHFLAFCNVSNNIITECRKALPPENFICRFYDPARLKNGNIIDDFFDIFQIEIQDIPRGQFLNERLPDAALPLLVSLFGLKTGRETEIKLQKLVAAAFTTEKSSVAVSRLNPETLQAIQDQAEALCPGYLDMFAERPFDLSFPETDMEPKERLVFELLFSLYAQNNELRNGLEALRAPSALQRELKTILRWGFNRLPGPWREPLYRLWRRWKAS